MYNKLYFNLYNKRLLNNLTTKRSFSIYNNELLSKLKSGNLTYYDVLQVPRNADKNKIKEAYLKLVKEYHPDKSKIPDARSIFICIQESYDVLNDSNKRILYDQKLSQFQQKIPKYNTSTTMRMQRDFDSDPFKSERWERYKRYTSGRRIDLQDDPYIWIKTITTIALSCITVTLVCMVAGNMLSQIPLSSSVDDIYTPNDVKKERMVKAYYNPITDNWERIIEPFDAPLPDVLLNYYRGKVGDLDVDNIPLRELTTIQMPLSHTVKPTVLYDRNKNKPVYIEN